MDLEQAKEWAHRAEPAEVFISSHPRRTQNALWALVAEVDRLTTANADLQQRLDAAEEALRVAQGEVERVTTSPSMICELCQIESVRKADEYREETFTLRTAGQQLNDSLTAANSRVERLQALTGEYEVLLAWASQRFQRAIIGLPVRDADELVSAINRVLSAKEALADDAKEGM